MSPWLPCFILASCVTAGWVFSLIHHENPPLPEHRVKQISACLIVFMFVSCWGAVLLWLLCQFALFIYKPLPT